MTDADFKAQAIRLHDRYLLEIVEPLGLCPWARRSRLDGRTKQIVLLDADVPGALDATRAAIAALTREEKIEVGFVIFPRIDLGRSDFDRFVARVNEREVAAHEVGTVPFVMAAFHPDARADEGTPERLIPFLRRTPDPCIQLVRSRVLDAVRANTPQGTSFIDAATFDFSTLRDEIPLRERIARTNMTTVNRVGLGEVTRLFDEIRADRDRTYAALRSAP